MSMLTTILSGQFVSNGQALNLSLPSGYVEFELTNISSLGSTGAGTPVMKAWGTSLMPAGAGIVASKTTNAATIALPVTLASGGFTIIADSGSYPLPAALTSTGISQANPAVVSLASTAGLSAGATVRVTNATGMLQISGWEFTLGTVTANTSAQLAFLNSSGFAAGASAASIQLIPFPARFSPAIRRITNITQAGSAVITLSVTHQYAVGDEVTIYCPSAFGMSQINGLSGVVTASDPVTNNTITVNINSTGFSAFAFPSSAVAAAGVQFPIVVPFGMDPIAAYQSLVNDATINISFTGVQIGASAQTSSETYQWVARQGVST